MLALPSPIAHRRASSRPPVALGSLCFMIPLRLHRRVFTLLPSSFWSEHAGGSLCFSNSPSPWGCMASPALLATFPIPHPPLSKASVDREVERKEGGSWGVALILLPPALWTAAISALRIDGIPGSRALCLTLTLSNFHSLGRGLLLFSFLFFFFLI